MAQSTESRGGKRRHARLAGVLLTCFVLAAVVFLTAVPTAWATPGESPQNHTIPTPGPTKEKKKPGPAAPTPEPEGKPNQTFQVRLGPGDGVHNVKMPNAGCIQINVYALPWQLLFQITPMSPSSAPTPPAGYRTTTVAYTLKVWDTRNGQETMIVSPDYFHTICYTDADLAAANGDPRNFVIAYFDAEKQEWVELDPTLIDEANRHAVGQTGHASWWALLARESVPEPLMLPETGETASGGGAPISALIVAAFGILLLGVGVWRRRVAAR